MRITREDAGDRWHVVGELDDGRRFEVWMPKTADTLDLVNFGEHLMALARRQASEKKA